MWSNLSTGEKRDLINSLLARLRADKLLETAKKVKSLGYLDEDDHHFLAPLGGAGWAPVPNHENGDFYGYTGWAMNYDSLVNSFPPVVVPYSPMAGNYFHILYKYRKHLCNPDYSFQELVPAIEKYDIDHGIGAVEHFCGDITIGMRLGWGGLLEKVHRYAALNGKDPETVEFYQAEESVVKTIIAWIRRTSDRIEELLKMETDPLILENLRGMLEANRWIEQGPPRSLREACQFMCWYNITGKCYNLDGCGGQIDEVLYPYYRADRDAGSIDDEDAVYFLAGVLLADTKYYQLGGIGRDKEDMINQVSWLLLDAADRLDITVNLTVRVHEGMDRAFFRKCVEKLFKHKHGWPRFSGDKSLVDGFMRNGFPEELARKRIAVGCHWMAIPGIEYGINDCIKVNFAKIFEVAFDELMALGETTMERLWELFSSHLACALETVFRAADFHLATHRYNSPELFLNLFTQGPIEKGRDASDYCLEYYNIGVDGVGIAVAADSFAALEQRVVDEGRITWLQVKNALRTNYASPQARRVRAFLLTADKYGQPKSRGLKWAKRISSSFSDRVARERTDGPVRFIPGLFSWSKTIVFGQSVGATPDGRLAGAPVNHGVNPMPGSVKSGEMTSLSDAIVAVQCKRGNTAPFQVELDPGITAGEGGVDKVMALFKTHLQSGGTLINANIIDEKTILAAHQDPSLFPDLVVRVTGFTAYFASLSPEFRQLVVDRIMVAQ